MIRYRMQETNELDYGYGYGYRGGSVGSRRQK
jgi:hypothetical protein